MMKLIFVLLVSWFLLGCEPSPKAHSSAPVQVVSGTPVKPGRGVHLPADHGEHKEQGIEWWYVTANLTAASGETFGAQWTLFRTLAALPVQSSWWNGQLYFAHFALQHQQSHVAYERFARVGQAGVSAAPFAAYIDDWSLNSKTEQFLPLQLTAEQGPYRIDLSLANSPLTLHGDQGYSQKTTSGHASYYYSYPFLQAKGTIIFNGQVYQVTGNAWYDREWSASLLDREQMGWDWFSVTSSSEPQQALMLFCIRGAKQEYQNCSGTRIQSDGQAQQIQHQDINLTPLQSVTIDGAQYPSKWRVTVPNTAPIIIETVTKNSVNKLSVKYWEGRVKVSGGFSGTGYAELVGY